MSFVLLPAYVFWEISWQCKLFAAAVLAVGVAHSLRLQNGDWWGEAHTGLEAAIEMRCLLW